MMILTLALLAAAADAGSAAATPGYFPPDYTQPRIICDPMRPDRRIPAVSAGQIASFTRHLRAAQEPVLAGKQAGEVLRFTWLRAMHAPVMVRIEMRGKAARLIAKEMSGRGGYDPGSIARTVERDLTAAEAGQIRALVKSSELDGMPAIECDRAVMMDGAHWLFEHAGPRDYRLVDRQSPSGGPLRALGITMLGLTGWTYEDVY